MELHLPAIRALYSTICLNQVLHLLNAFKQLLLFQRLFNQYIESVFARPENLPNRERLIAEYHTLCPPDEKFTDTRQSFKAFHSRFERFAGAVEPILVL
jgi:hypothetical protein